MKRGTWSFRKKKDCQKHYLWVLWTKLQKSGRTRSRIYIFIKALIAIAVFLNVVENLSPCNKVPGRNSFFSQTDTHTIQLWSSFEQRLYSSSSPSLSRQSIVLRPRTSLSPNLFPSNAHKKYNIFLSFDPATSSSFLPCPRSLSVSVRLFVCLAGSVSLIRRGSPDASRNRSRSGRLDCFVLWDSNMNYKPAPWLLHSRSLILPGPLSHRISLSTVRSRRELGRMYKYGILLPETRVKIKDSLFITSQHISCVG